MKKLHFLILTLIGWCCTLTLLAQNFYYKGLTYRVLSETEKTAEVVTGSRNNGLIVIPEFVNHKGNQYEVTAIGDDAFGGCSDLISIDFGNVTTIGDRAFYRCDNLKRIKAPAKVPILGNDVFSDRYSREKVNIYVPNGSEDSYKGDFQWCNFNFYAYEMYQDETFYQIHSLSEKTATYLTSINPFPEKIVIPKSVEYKGTVFQIDSIGYGAFDGCTSLHYIDLKNVTTIGDKAFSDCSALNSIDFKNVTTIGDWAFEGCSSLTSIDFKNVTTIGDDAFWGCSDLISIDFGNVTTIGDWAFSGCSDLTSIDFKNVSTIGNGAFSNCYNLKRIKAPAKVPSIGSDVFNNNSNVKVYVPYGSKEIYEVDTRWNQFDLCTYEICQDDILYKINSLSEKTATCLGSFDSALRDIVIPESVEYKGTFFKIDSIGIYAFKGLSSLNSVDLGNVTMIGNGAFSRCYNLKRIKVPVKVPSIGSDAFNNNSNVKVYVPCCSKDLYEVDPQWNQFNLCAYEIYQDEILYKINSLTEKTATCLGSFDSALSDIVIPESIEYKGTFFKIDSIGMYAFKGLSSLSSVDLGNVITIGDWAFEGCSSLTSIDFKNVTAIGDWAFGGCSDLTSIDFKNVSTIGICAFVGCSSLTSIDFKHVSTIGYTAFSGCSALSSIDFKNVTTIGNGAFLNCSGLVSIDFENVTTIESEVFKNCVGLAFLNLKNVTTIGYWAFEGCSGLVSIDFGNVTTIGDKAFKNCTGLTSLDFKNVITIGEQTFDGCSSLAYIDLRNITTIEKQAFSHCSDLPSVDFKNVKVIGERAFNGCSSLSSVDFRNVTTIEKQAFAHCSDLPSVDFKNVKVIGERAFNGCSGLSSVDFKNVTTIGEQAFYGCSGLTSIDFKNVTTIGDGAFKSCSNLTSLNLMNVRMIGHEAFSACDNLKKVYVPIKAPFQNYSFPSQTRILIPSGNLSSYQGSHYSWNEYVLIEYDFTEVDMDYKIISEQQETISLVGPAIDNPIGRLMIPKVSHNKKRYNITEIGTVVFRDCKDITAFDSDKVKVIRKSAFEGCLSLDSLILRDVEFIETDAFKSCGKLKTIIVYSTAPPVIYAESAFNAETYLDATLYVPIGYKKVYEETPCWKNFFIVESDELTGIEKTDGKTASATNIYDLNGRLVRANTTSTEDLQLGIYIINGKKVMVK